MQISPKDMQTSPKVSIQQHALKGQKLLAQGIALGIVTVSNAPCKGKSFKTHTEIYKAFALTGRVFKIRIKNPA